MGYDELITNWHAKASQEDYFSKYVFEYLAFIGYLKRKKFTNANTDRSAIQSLKSDHTIRNRYLHKITSLQDLGQAWENIKLELDRSSLGNASRNFDEVEELKWWNCPHEFLEQQTIEERQKPKGVIHDLSDWAPMVEFWYSIRNNLFHGAKDPQDNRDKLLVKNGYKTLRSLVELFLLDQEKYE